jgi:hypothetical protein
MRKGGLVKAALTAERIAWTISQSYGADFGSHSDACGRPEPSADLLCELDDRAHRVHAPPTGSGVPLNGAA